MDSEFADNVEAVENWSRRTGRSVMITYTREHGAIVTSGGMETGTAESIPLALALFMVAADIKKINKHGLDFGQTVKRGKFVGKVVGFHPPDCGHHKPVIVQWDNDTTGEQPTDFNASELEVVT